MGYYKGGGDKTIAKLVILDKYLKAYTNILGKDRNWSGEIWYVDTHAGSGYTNVFDVDLPGSSLRSLNHPFDRYYFYENDPTHFDLLCEAIEDYLDIELDYDTLNGTGDTYAKCNHPRIRAFNSDCNEGAEWLIRNSGGNSHWFTFIDPERLTVERLLLDSLLERGNMDILYNFQTSGFVRAGADGAEHGHEKVEMNVGSDFPPNASAEEWVEWFKDEMFVNTDFEPRPTIMESESDDTWRYDLIFASANKTAYGIMDDIMGGDLQGDIQSEVLEYRSKSESAQQGLEQYDIRVSNEEDRKNASLFSDWDDS